MKSGTIKFVRRTTPDALDVIDTFKGNQSIKYDVSKLIACMNRDCEMEDEFEIPKEICSRCDGAKSITCDLGHEHSCPDCGGNGVIGGHKPTGKKIPNKRTIFSFNGVNITYETLYQYVIRTAMDLDCQTITLVYFDENKPMVFEIGEAGVLIMPVAVFGLETIKHLKYEQ